MKVKRRIEIITVREQTYQRHNTMQFSSTPSAPQWCDGCQTQRQMLDSEIAAMISGITLRTLFRWIESGQIHFVETLEGKVLICLQSVTAKATQLESEGVFSNGSSISNEATFRSR